jgi:hypothetical protein
MLSGFIHSKKLCLKTPVKPTVKNLSAIKHLPFKLEFGDNISALSLSYTKIDIFYQHSLKRQIVSEKKKQQQVKTDH